MNGCSLSALPSRTACAQGRRSGSEMSRGRVPGATRGHGAALQDAARDHEPCPVAPLAYTVLRWAGGGSPTL